MRCKLWNKILLISTGLTFLLVGMPEYVQAQLTCAALFKKSQSEIKYRERPLEQGSDPEADQVLTQVQKVLDLRTLGAKSSEKVKAFQELAEALFLIKEKFESSRGPFQKQPYVHLGILSLLNYEKLVIHLVNSFLFISGARESTMAIVHSLLSIGYYYFADAPHETYLYRYIRERSMELADEPHAENPLHLLFQPLIFMDGTFIENRILHRESAFSKYDLILEYLNELVYNEILDPAHARLIVHKVVYRTNPIPLSRREKELILQSLVTGRDEKNVHIVLEFFGFVEIYHREVPAKKPKGQHATYWSYVYAHERK